MNQARLLRCYKQFSSLLPAVVFLAAAAIQGSPLRGQDAPQGPIAPPSAEHHVTRIGNEAEPAAPPSLPEAEIVKRFSQKEDEYILSRTHYTYRKTIRIQEFGADGQLFEKVIERPRSTLQHLFLRSEDLEGLQRIPAFPLTSSQLAKYDVKYLGKEQVDEIECYIFQAKPKMVERVKAYFDGIVWVDAKYLEVVKTYGKWVTDQGDMHTIADLPFSLFETYRENVDEKYWFPNYSRSDGTLNLKGLEIPVRLVVKWTDFKPVPSAPQAATPPAAATPAKP